MLARLDRLAHVLQTLSLENAVAYNMPYYVEYSAIKPGAIGWD